MRHPIVVNRTDLTLASLWIAKLTVSEFLKRLISQAWRRSYQIGLQFIRWFLVVTFTAVVIATLAECQPFYKYSQVVPDPGPNCRQGHAQLITMGISDMITDLLLVIFPIPIVLRSSMIVKRKLSLVSLFSFSLILVGITTYRVIGVIDRHSDQQFRSLLASLEILAAAAVSNAVVLGSFIRDRGEKKRRFRFESTAGSSSLDTSHNQQRSRTLTQRHWGSDADLVGDLGMRVARDLEEHETNVPRPAPVALPLVSHAAPPLNNNWNFASRPSIETDETDLKAAVHGSEKYLSPTDIRTPAPTPRRMSFFDVGGLLEDESSSAPRHPSVGVVSPIATPHIALNPSPTSSEPPTEVKHLQEHRRGGHALLRDIGEISAPASSHQTEMTLRSAPTTQHPTRPPSLSRVGPRRSIQSSRSLGSPPKIQPEGQGHIRWTSFRDVGGLLD